MRWKQARFAAIALALPALLVAGATSAQSISSDDAEFSRGQLRASELLGAAVENEQGQEIGEIDDLILSKENDIVTAVISVGGFLGLGEKLISLPYAEISVTGNGGALLVAMTQAELEAEPSFHYETERADSAAADSAAAPREPEEPISNLVGSASEGTRSEPRERRAAAPAPEARPETPAGDATTATQASESRSAAPANEASSATPATAATGASRGQSASVEREGGTPIETMERDAHKASELIGLTIVDSQGEEVGEVDDLVVSAGAEVLAVLSVGGLIGIGDTLVAVPLDELDLETDPQPERARRIADAAQVRLAMTAEQLLDAAPEFQYEPGVVH